MTTTADGAGYDAYGDLVAELAAVGLPAPLIPATLAADLARRGQFDVATPGAPTDLLDAGDDALDGWCRDPSVRAAAVVHQGRGRVSWALHELLLDARLAVYVQVTWGGADEEDRTADVAAAFAAADRLVRAAESAADGSGHVAVYLSDRADPRWAALPRTSVDPRGITWRSGAREAVVSAAMSQLTDGEEPGAEPAGDDEPTLEGYLTTTDVDALAEWATEMRLPDEAGLRLIARAVGAWEEPQAVANLLLHPLLLPDEYRTKVIVRALSGAPDDYLTFAALVGITDEREDVIASDEVQRVVALASELAAQQDEPLVARRAAGVLARLAAAVDPDVLIALATHPDAVVRHNAVVAALRRLGAAGAADALDGATSDDPEVTAWLDAARQELSATKDDLELLATRFASPTATGVPSMPDWPAR